MCYYSFINEKIRNIKRKRNKIGASLVTQWQESICQFRRHGFDPWYGKIAHAKEQLSLLLLLLLLPSCFSRVRLCATPWTAANQAPPSLGFSRQEHWSGLPSPSPMHESEKWKWSRSVVSNSTTSRTAAHQAPPSKGFSRQEYWSGVPLPSN